MKSASKEGSVAFLKHRDLMTLFPPSFIIKQLSQNINDLVDSLDIPAKKRIHYQAIHFLLV